MIYINLKNGQVESMSIDEFSRWMCLVEAFHFIEQKAEELNVSTVDLLKPLAIDEYIKERFESMKHDVICENNLGNK